LTVSHPLAVTLARALSLSAPERTDINLTPTLWFLDFNSLDRSTFRLNNILTKFFIISTAIGRYSTNGVKEKVLSNERKKPQIPGFAFFAFLHDVHLLFLFLALIINKMGDLYLFLILPVR
jgi:hypothetical protein